MHGPFLFLAQDNITIRINRKKIFYQNNFNFAYVLTFSIKPNIYYKPYS